MTILNVMYVSVTYLSTSHWRDSSHGSPITSHLFFMDTCIYLENNKSTKGPLFSPITSSIPWLLDARWSHLGTLALVPTDGVGGALLVFLLQEALGHFSLHYKMPSHQRSCSESISQDSSSTTQVTMGPGVLEFMQMSQRRMPLPVTGLLGHSLNDKMCPNFPGLQLFFQKITLLSPPSDF